MSGGGTLKLIAETLTAALAPLEQAFRDEESFKALLGQIGWDPLALPPSYAATADRVQAALDAVEGLADDPDIKSALQVIRAAGQVYEALASLPEAPPGLDAPEFLAEAARRLFDLLLVQYFRTQHPRALGSLEALGVVSSKDVPAAAGQPGWTRYRFDWELLPERLTNLDALAGVVYGWGAAEFSPAKVFEILSDWLIALGLHVSIDRVSKELSSAYQALAGQPPNQPIDIALSAYFFDFEVGGTLNDIGFRLLALPSEGTALPGLVLQPEVPSGIDQKIEFAPNWNFEVRAGTDLAQKFGIVLRPDEVSVRYPFAPGTPPPSAGAGISLSYAGPEPASLLGQSGGSRLELGAAKLSSELNFKANDLELKFDVVTERMALVVSPSDFDGFLGSALGGKDIRVEFPLSLGWSSRTGFNFRAGLGFELSAYPHLDLRFMRVDRIDLGLRFIAAIGDQPYMELRAAAALSGAIGPISYVVDGLGLHLPVRFEEGNAGPVDIGFDVLKPLGLELVVDAGALTGGGFIKFEPDKGRYVGMIELKMFEVSISAVAILDTRDASGAELPSPGFSFFLALSMTMPAIQLGFGFTLNGVGGLVGINRRMDSAAIVSKMREGVLDSLMFPADPIANANVIVSNLSTIFPIAPNRYVFGPMALIGWGTPTLVKIKLAIVLEVPQPILLALLGQASIAIPAEDAAIIAINFDVVGILDFGRSTFAVDATLRDSRIAAFALTGDMAMRMAWGDKPNFALAIGGFNPHFTAPPGFPSLRRITVALGNGANPRITLEGYFAITSNSLQFGAKAELCASRGGFSIKGWVGFDALLIFDPLSFEFDFAAGMTLNRGSSRIAGITVRGTLTGPSPFHAKGEGCISLFFFDVCVPFDATFGDKQGYELPERDPWPLLEAAIKLPANWSGELGNELQVAVTLTSSTETLGPMVHPMAAATLRQKVLPLNRPLERFGEFEVMGPKRYDVADVVAGSDGDPGWGIVTDYFAPGSFEALSESDKLSRDSFEEMAAGVKVAGNDVAFAPAAVKVAGVNYETRIIDAGWKSRKLPPFHLPRDVQFAAILQGAKAGSVLTRSGRQKFAAPGNKPSGIRLAAETYSVASTETLMPDLDLSAPMTRGAAYLALKTSGSRSATSHLQVVPVHELEDAA